MKQAPEITENKIKQYLVKFPGVKIGICGDFYLDRYIVGVMNGISREAPVPIIRTSTDNYSPGGGGTIALNLGSMQTQGYCIGPLGDDLSGKIAMEKFAEAGVNTGLTWQTDYRRTPTFNKIYGYAYFGKIQQVARFDQENEVPLNKKDISRLIDNIEKAFQECDFIIFSDYGEVENTGILLPEVLEGIESLNRKYDTPTLGNSRLNIINFRGFTYLTVNDYEAGAAAGLVSTGSTQEIDMDTVIESGRRLIEKTDSDNVFITLGPKGILIVRKDGSLMMVPTIPAGGDLDVTGAGDTTMAAIASVIAAGGPDYDACHMGNLAAATTVKKLNTTGFATHDEILGEFHRRESLDK